MCHLADGHPHVHSGIDWGHQLWWKAAVPVVLGEGFPRVVVMLGLTTPQPDFFQVPSPGHLGAVSREETSLSAPGQDHRMDVTAGHVPRE